MLNDEIENDCIKRIKKINGQILGIEKMINEKRYCIDIVFQIKAVKAALHKISAMILKNHIETCVLSSFNTADEKDKKKKINELIDIFNIDY